MTTSITGHCAGAPFNGSGAYAAAGAFRADAVYSRASDIVIQTLEGDRVTISSSAYEAGGYETYGAFATENDAAAWQYGESAWFESRRELSVSIKGDLSNSELKDIEKIVQTLDKMMEDLASGDLESALAGSAEFNGIDSIASFFADMRIYASVAVGRSQTTAVSMPPPAVSQSGDGRTAEWIDRLADHFLRGVDTKTASMDKLIETLEKYLFKWFETKSSETGNCDNGVKWASRFARRLLSGLESSCF